MSKEVSYESSYNVELDQAKHGWTQLYKSNTQIGNTINKSKWIIKLFNSEIQIFDLVMHCKRHQIKLIHHIICFFRVLLQNTSYKIGYARSIVF